jgi:hypothetical protein
MKNLFEISSEEKQRILEMHVSATKKNYLSEQETQPTTQPTGTTQTTTQSPDLSNLGIKDINGIRTIEVPQKDKKNLKSIINQKGESIFGKGKFEILQGGSDDLVLIVNKDSYQKLLSDEGITVQQNIHCAEPRWNGKNWVYKQKSFKSTGGFAEKILNFDNFNRILNGKGSVFGCSEQDRHILDGNAYKGDYSGGNFFNQELRNASAKFFQNPTANFSNLCNFLKPTSYYRINGFPGVGQKCQISINGSSAYNQIEERIPKNEFVRVQVMN